MSTIASEVIMVLLLSLFVLPSTILLTEGSETILVPGEYPTLQEAINAARPGDTILVSAGRYFGDVIVNKSLNIFGEGSANTSLVFYNLVVSCDYVNFTGFTLGDINTFAPVKIEFSNCSYCNFFSNIFHSEQSQMRLDHSNRNRIFSNTLRRTNDGHTNGAVVVGLADSEYNTFYNNSIGSDDNGCLSLDNSNNNIFLGNVMSGAGYFGAPALTLGTSTNNTFSSNSIITQSSDANTILLSQSPSNYFVENDFHGENFLLFIQSSDNTIYHNNVFCYVSTDGSSNLWDNGYPSGGNHWSAYAGTDANGDGIGDTPYIIDANNQDDYPLMKAYAGLHDLGITGFIVSKTVIGKGFNIIMSAKVLNYGNSIEAFILNTYVNETLYTSSTSIGLPPGCSTFLDNSFNSASFAYGTYVLKAIAVPVAGETDTSDNNVTVSVKVTIPGDINGDFIVDLSDTALMGIYWRRIVPPAPVNVDINDDGIIDISDAAIVGLNWMRHYP